MQLYKLGEYYRFRFPKSKESSYKLGVRMIYERLDKKISKHQIKVFTNKCNGFTKNHRSIPYSSMKIFYALTSLIDEIDVLRKSCKSQCENCINHIQSNYCRDKMVYDFYMLLCDNEKFLNGRIIEEIYRPMEMFNKECL